MRTLSVFNAISLDGYFTDAHGDMSWAKQQDPEMDDFTTENASGGGELIFGRVTYEMMMGFWTTREAHEAMPVVAEQMNKLPKVVFSRTLDAAPWTNTELIRDDIVEAMRQRKQAPGLDMVIMGSGTIVTQLTEAGLIDSYQFVVNPIVLGRGRTLFEGVTNRQNLQLTNSREFKNGNVVVTYELADRA